LGVSWAAEGQQTLEIEPTQSCRNQLPESPRPVRISPWADYGIVGGEDGHLSIDLRRTPFDVDAFLALSLESGMPHAEWLANWWVRD
jgi:hypothetical protein